MKKLYYFLTVSLLVLFTIEANAQMTHIPDANFRQALVDLGYGAGAVGNDIPTANLSGITTLDVEFKTITDLTGIEAFIALKILNCSRNGIKNLDVSKNTALTYLYCDANKFTTLDVSKNTELIGLFCFDNDLRSLDVRNGNNAEFTDFDATNNPNLTCIYVDDKDIYYSFWEKDFLSTYANDETECVPLTYVPDNNFLQALIDLGHGTGAIGNDIPTANLSSVTSLDVTNKNIANLSGIQDFVGLKILNCAENVISSLDVSKNIALTELYCGENLFKILDVTENTALTVLDCIGLQLEFLDVSNNKALTKLDCRYTALTSLDVRNGNNATITDFDATNNPDLTCIYVDDKTADLSAWEKDATASFANNEVECGTVAFTNIPDANFLQALKDLGYGAGAVGNDIPTANLSAITTLNVSEKNISDLTGIQDFVALTTLKCEINNLSVLNVTKNTKLTELSCSENKLESLDVSKNIALIDLKLDDNGVSLLDVSNNTALKVLWCDKNEISVLDVSKNTALNVLWCEENDLSVLDVSKNTKLIELRCTDNNLSVLDVSKNTALTTLSCAENDLSALDVTENIKLTYFDCAFNLLTSLDVRNGNNANILDFYATDNADLSCICVDNKTASYLSGWIKDATAKFVNTESECGVTVAYTNIPDNNFLQALKALGHDTGAVGNNIPTANLSAITSLDVTNKNISDLTGIQDFVALTVLTCDNNQLTTLDISKNIVLIKLWCENNELSVLDVSKNIALTELACSKNKLTSLDVSKNTALMDLECQDNELKVLDVSKNPALIILSCGINSKLTVLDVSKNPALEEFQCYENNITSLDVSKNTKLALLGCEDNKLTTLDVSKNTKLTELTCYNNQLTSLDVRNGNNANFTTFQALNNPDLSCIYVVDNTASYLTTWKKDATATFVNTEAECDALTSVEDIKMQTISIYPNPTNGIVNFDFSGEHVQKMKIVTIAGKTVFQKENISETETIDISGFANGLYIVILQTDNGSNSFKIIKE